MHWLVLTLMSAFSIATADALVKKYLSHYMPGELVLVRFGIPGALLLPLLIMTPWPATNPVFWGWMASLVPLELGAMWLYMHAIRESPLSLTLPYLAFTPVFNILTGYLFLGEQVSLMGTGGILLVVSGAWLLNIDAARNNGGWLAVIAPFRAIITERGSRLMLAAAAIYSLTSVIGKVALLHVTPDFFGALYFVVVGIGAVIIFAPRRLPARRPSVGIITAQLAVGACMAIMVVTHFYAIAHVEVAYMLAVKRTSLLFGMLYGAWLFHEQGLGRNLLAGLLMIVGVFLIIGTASF